MSIVLFYILTLLAPTQSDTLLLINNDVLSDDKGLRWHSSQMCGLSTEVSDK